MEEITADEAAPAEALCPSCGVEVRSHKCRLCGSTRTVNQVSGRIIWMKSGRVIRAFEDDRHAYVEMAKAYNIPEERWPARFRS